ncbi:hypothetical protein N7486_007357 [Penicillium sp. IBT 16267x]|nr:hypothetical protein N7486_007357 [Penicillium sp. IBT 16267x]
MMMIIPGTPSARITVPLPPRSAGFHAHTASKSFKIHARPSTSIGPRSHSRARTSLSSHLSPLIPSNWLPRVTEALNQQVRRSQGNEADRSHVSGYTTLFFHPRTALDDHDFTQALSEHSTSAKFAADGFRIRITELVEQAGGKDKIRNNVRCSFAAKDFLSIELHWDIQLA